MIKFYIQVKDLSKTNGATSIIVEGTSFSISHGNLYIFNNGRTVQVFNKRYWLSIT